MTGIKGVYIYDEDGNVVGATGAKLTVLKNTKNDPEFYKKIGAKGGRNGTEGGFKSTVVGKDGLTGRERARVAGSKGGTKSRRRANVEGK